MEILLASRTTVALQRAVYTCTSQEFASFQALMKSVSATPNKYRPSTNIHRKQCAFFRPSAPVQTYDFGQKQDSNVLEIKDMHPLLARLFSSMPPSYNMVQCNYYEDASVAISPHQDNESCIDPCHPIVSVTLYANVCDTRKFSFYTLADEKVVDVILGHGDVLTMTCQSEYKHGIEKERRTNCGPRLNFTFRVAMEP